MKVEEAIGLVLGMKEPQQYPHINGRIVDVDIRVRCLGPIAGILPHTAARLVCFLSKCWIVTIDDRAPGCHGGRFAIKAIGVILRSGHDHHFRIGLFEFLQSMPVTSLVN